MALKEIKRDLERAYIGVDNAAVTGNSSTAREMASATQQISTDVDAGTNATDPLTEAKLLTLGETVFNNGSDPSVFMINQLMRRSLLALQLHLDARTFNDGNTSLVNVIDLYVSPYGEYKVVLNRHQLTTHAFLIDPAMFRSSVLRPFARTLLGKTADGDTHAVVGEYSLKHMNFADSGMISGLS